MIITIMIINLLFCIFDYRKNRDFFSPIFIFNAIWFITLCLYELKLSYLQQELIDNTKIIFLYCVLTYNLVNIILEVIKKKTSKNKNITKDNKLTVLKRKYTVEQKLTYAKYLAILIFIIEIFYSQGVPFFWKIFGVNKSYMSFGIPSLNGFFYSLITVLGAYSIMKKSKDSFLYLSIGLLVISRQIIMSMIIEGFISLLYTNKEKIKLKNIIIVGIIVFLSFSLVGNFRSGTSTMNDVFNAKEQYEKLPTSIKWIYSYMTFSISNFNNLVSKTNGGLNHGISSLKQFLPTILLEHLNLTENYKVFYLVSLNYTVSTYLPPIYMDFGKIGIIIFNMIIGFLGYYLYSLLKKEKNDRNVLMYSIFAHNIVFLFFTNMFLQISISFQFIIVMILFNNLNEKRNEDVEEK